MIATSFCRRSSHITRIRTEDSASHQEKIKSHSRFRSSGLSTYSFAFGSEHRVLGDANVPFLYFRVAVLSVLEAPRLLLIECRWVGGRRDGNCVGFRFATQQINLVLRGEY